MDRPDLTPTAGMQEEARRYLRWKNAGHRGGTAVATRRAHQILAAKPLSPTTVRTMAAWFARHAVDRKGKGFRPGEDGYPSPGRVAWAAWGGDPGERWSRQRTQRLLRQGILQSRNWKSFPQLAFLAHAKPPASVDFSLSPQETDAVRAVAHQLFSRYQLHAARSLLLATGVSLVRSPAIGDPSLPHATAMHHQPSTIHARLTEARTLLSAQWSDEARERSLISRRNAGWPGLRQRWGTAETSETNDPSSPSTAFDSLASSGLHTDPMSADEIEEARLKVLDQQREWTDDNLFSDELRADL